MAHLWTDYKQITNKIGTMENKFKEELAPLKEKQEEMIKTQE